MHTHRRTDQKQQCHSLNQVKWTGEWGPLASVSGIHSVRIAAGKPYQTPLLIRVVTCEAVSSSAPSRGPDCKAACRPAYGLLPGRWTQKKGQRLCEPASFLPSHYPLRFIPFAMGRHVGEKNRCCYSSRNLFTKTWVQGIQGHSLNNVHYKFNFLYHKDDSFTV